MERLTPAELLGFLEAESATFHLMHSKITNQLHCLKVEEELFNRQLLQLKKSSANIDGCAQSEQEFDGFGNEYHLGEDIQSVDQHSTTPLRSSEQSRPGPKMHQLPGTLEDREGIHERKEIGSDDDLEIEFQKELFGQEIGSPAEICGSDSSKERAASKTSSGKQEISDTTVRENEDEENLEMELQIDLVEQEISPHEISGASSRKKRAVRKKPSGRQEIGVTTVLESEGELVMQTQQHNHGKDSSAVRWATSLVGAAEALSLSGKRTSRRPLRYAE